MNWLIKFFLYLRVRYKWFKKVKDIPNHRLTFTSMIQPDLVKDYFPWGKNYEYIRTNYDQLRQRYGRFHAMMSLREIGCFSLLNISRLPYEEIDHIEIFDDHLQVTTWHGKWGGQQQVEPNENINPLFTGHNHFNCPHKTIEYRNPLIREWILTGSHLFTIIWRKWFVAWYIDEILIAIVLFHPIPKMHLYMLATNCDWTYFESEL